MRAERRAADWDTVWAAYDARQLARGEKAPPPRPAPDEGTPAPRRRRSPRRLPLALAAGALLLGAWFATPWMLGARLSAAIGRGDAPGLLRQIDAPAMLASLRAALAAELPAEERGGAQRYLSGMADRMADAWTRPEGLEAWLRLRAPGGRPEGAAVPAATLRAARAVGLTAFQVEYGPPDEADGVAFEVDWQGDGFRVTGVRFLSEPPAPVHLAGPVIAAR